MEVGFLEVLALKLQTFPLLFLLIFNGQCILIIFAYFPLC